MPDGNPRRSAGRGFRHLLTAAAVSNLGDGVTWTAAPLLANSLTDDPRLVAGLAAVTSLPWLVFTLVSGALVDRLDRRRTMWIVDAWRAVGIGAVALLVATDTARLPVLYAVFFALGLGETLFDNASVALLPGVVEARDLNRANGRLQAVSTVANQFAGPPIGGLVFAAAAAAPFALDAVSFALSALLIARIRGSFAPRPPDPDGPQQRLSAGMLRRDIGEGWRYLLGQPLLRRLAAFLGVWNLISTATFATLVLLATRRLGLDEAGFGLLLTFAALGGIAAGFVAERIVDRLGPSRTLQAALVSGTVGLAVPFTRSPVVVAAVFAVEGFAGTVWNVVTLTLRQELVPDVLLGRLTSAYRLVGVGTLPLGAVLGGFLVRSFGLTSPYWVGGTASAAMALAATVLLRRSVIDAALSGPDAPPPNGPGSP